MAQHNFVVHGDLSGLYDVIVMPQFCFKSIEIALLFSFFFFLECELALFDPCVVNPSCTI